MVKLLVVVDDAGSALAAVRHAAFLYREGGVSSVVLLNVQSAVDQPAATTPRMKDIAQGRRRDVERRRGAIALRRACDILDDSGVDYLPAIGVGPAARAIAHVAEARRCDGILLGSTFWSRLNACFGGVLQARLMRLARVPVTLVRAEAAVAGASHGELPNPRSRPLRPLVVDVSAA